MSKIGIILGSDSDYPYLEKSVKFLREHSIPFEIEISSAHRTPQRTIDIIKRFENSGVEVIIAAAGGAAHLPGVIASHTLLPVLGIPIKSSLSGLDSLYSIVQMPGGIPVATFGIGNSGGFNSVLFALEIMALKDEKIRAFLKKFREDQKKEVMAKSERLKNLISDLY